MREKLAALPNRIELPQSSLVVRVRSLNSGDQIRKSKGAARMATYRVVLRVDVDKDAVLSSRGAEVFKELEESEEDYLRAHIENEMGWLKDSFSRVETESVTRLGKRKQMRKPTK